MLTITAKPSAAIISAYLPIAIRDARSFIRHPFIFSNYAIHFDRRPLFKPFNNILCLDLDPIGFQNLDDFIAIRWNGATIINDTYIFRQRDLDDLYWWGGVLFLVLGASQKRKRNKKRYQRFHIPSHRQNLTDICALTQRFFRVRAGILR
jgi:hypothetical protein